LALGGHSALVIIIVLAIVSGFARKHDLANAKCQTLTASANSSAPHYHGGMNLGMPEMIFIFLLALVVVGPRKLPELGRQLGKFLAEFKRASNEFKNQLETEMLNIELEERAKKAQNGEVLPKEEPWERLMRPINETVSRGRSELLAAVNAEHAPARPAPVPDEPLPPAKTASGE
jgi:Tat protein translocase TatB subunit